METLLGFHVGFWDYVNFVAMFAVVVALLTAGVLVLGLPSPRNSSTQGPCMAKNDPLKEPLITMRLIVTVLALIAIFASPANAQAPSVPWTQIGSLRCTLNPNIGFIITGHQSMECWFSPKSADPPQAYDGAINMVGLNIDIATGGVLAWAVFAPTSGAPVGALAGEYVGSSSDIGVIAGAATNILIGGSGRTFALQPVSTGGSVAVNVALGISVLKLRAAR